MRSIALPGLVTLLTVSTLGVAGEANRPARPRLGVRAAPRVALSPAHVIVVAELSGGDELEEFYCTGTVWDWNDGDRSFSEGDCPPFEPGSKIERQFSSEHRYRRAGNYMIKVTMVRAHRSVAAATVNVTVRPGAGEASDDN